MFLMRLVEVTCTVIVATYVVKYARHKINKRK
jgi:hypothetical protein